MHSGAKITRPKWYNNSCPLSALIAFAFKGTITRRCAASRCSSHAVSPSTEAAWSGTAVRYVCQATSGSRSIRCAGTSEGHRSGAQIHQGRFSLQCCNCVNTACLQENYETVNGELTQKIHELLEQVRLLDAQKTSAVAAARAADPMVTAALSVCFYVHVHA